MGTTKHKKLVKEERRSKNGWNPDPGITKRRCKAEHYTKDEERRKEKTRNDAQGTGITKRRRKREWNRARETENWRVLGLYNIAFIREKMIRKAHKGARSLS